MSGVPPKPDQPLAIGGLHLAALISLAVAQPIFTMLASEPMPLVTHQARPADIIVLAALLCLVLPGVIWGLECGIQRFSPAGRKIVHLLLVAILAGLIALPAWKRLVLLPGPLLCGLAGVTAVVAAAAYYRFAAVRTLVTFLSPCAVVLPALFLLRNPVWSLLFPLDSPALAAQANTRRPHVVMVVFDEFCSQSLLDEHRQIDAIRYPNFARLADECTWFANATTVDENTMHAVPAILTGCYPDHNRPPTFSNYSRNLFTLLDQAGYELVVFEPFTTLCPDDETPQNAAASRGEHLRGLAEELLDCYERFVLPGDFLPPDPPRRVQEILRRQFERQRQKTTGVMRYERLANRREQFEHFIECLKNTEKPRLYFLHILLPHAPYRLLPSGRRHSFGQDMQIGIGGIAGAIGLRSEDEFEAEQDQQFYLLQLGAVDYYVGRLMDRLKREGLYDESLLVLTADHGVSFRAGQPSRGTTRETYADIMSIPLFVKAPGQKQGHVSNRNIEAIDIFPSMADALDLELPWPTDGSSAFDPAVSERPTKVIHSLSAGTMTFDAAFLDKDRALFQMLSRFGSGAKPNGLYLIGPHPEFVGKAPENVQPGDLRVRIGNWPAAFENVDRSGVFVPCALSGQVEPVSPQSEPREVAIAINGIVRAVTRTSTDPSRPGEWLANVPEEAFVDGANAVEVYIVQRREDRLILERATIIAD